MALLAIPIVGAVRNDNPAIVPNIMSFQLVEFIMNLLFLLILLIHCSQMHHLLLTNPPTLPLPNGPLNRSIFP